MTSWHQIEVAEVVTQLNTDLTLGLTSDEAAQRLAQYGPNELKAHDRVTAWSILFEQFRNVLVVILLIAVALSALLGHTLEAIVIAIIVLFAVILGFLQEYRAERAIDALRKMAAPLATVVRDGKEQAVQSREVVPGDLILVRAGSKIPADARLVEAVNLQVEEAALTGESLPVEKHTAALAGADSVALPVGDRRNMIYGGTSVTYGRGRAVVVATGMQSEVGAIAQLLETVSRGKTPLQENLDRVGHMLARAALVVVLLIVALGVVRGQPVLEMFIFGIALAVAVVPEALPAVVTISLAIGVQRMVKRNALVRRLSAVETLGSVSVIGSDKTGTLTRDEMTVRRLFVADESWSVTGAGYEPTGAFLRNGAPETPSQSLSLLLRAGVLASDAQLSQEGESGLWEVMGDPTEGALLVAAAKAGLYKAELDVRYPRTQEIPFTSESKRMTTLHDEDGVCVAYAKGAPEVILEACTMWQTANGAIEMSSEDRRLVVETAQQMAGEALRVLAVAYKADAALDHAAREMTFVGLAGMIDPPRPEAKLAIQQCADAGIKVVMVTGDHPLTARAVADDLGLLKTGRVITGVELDAMSEADLQTGVDAIEVYARVSPAHKLRVVTALQQRGYFVAMTGDGVNDAPALKKADIGVAMGITGTDVTKEAADMTLTDDNFASIVAAVEEGRAVFGNVKKYLMFLLSSNIGEILLMFGASLFGLPLPLTAVQILYVNLATDGLPALALAFDPPEPDLMQRPPRNPRTGIFTRPVVALMTIGGVWSAIVNLGLFTWALNSGRSQAEAMTMTFVLLVLIQFVKAYNYRSDRHSVLRRPFANRWLNRAILWELLLLALILYVPFLNEPFSTFPLTLLDWAIVTLLAFSVLPVLEAGKWMLRRGWFGSLAS